ncbi:hypothetical protein CDL12_26804 [Handroanthus impetiginosus]|uniref:Uncharacterized protein n=1 Tax=Handroanthus impetiginosus TaxID=429701 RepID=A0A2G9G5V4_9LAMI|nr:hypothetical protein CDL12_26804 [Handroanthus impetiginosus]
MRRNEKPAMNHFSKTFFHLHLSLQVTCKFPLFEVDSIHVLIIIGKGTLVCDIRRHYYADGITHLLHQNVQ